MVKLFLMGDSTMKKNNYYSYPQTGWGQGLELFVKEGVQIVNYAENGRSTKSFIDEGRFERILNEISKGDYVICSFGHNDEKMNDPSRYTQPYGSYTDNLRYFKLEIEKRGGKIVFATSITRHKFNQKGECINSHGEYPQAMLDFCLKNKCTCIDMNKYTRELYTKLGEEETKKFHMIFPPNTFSNYMEGKDDHSHLVHYGAVRIAYIFVEELSKTNDSLNSLFIDLTATNQIDSKMLID